MTRSRAGILLAVTGCASALFASGVPFAVPVACIVALSFIGTVLEHKRLRLRDLPLVLLHVAVFGAAFFAAVLREPQMPLLQVVLTFSGPLLVLRCLMPHTVFNDFLKVLVGLVLVLCSAERAEAWWPVLITAAYLLVACQAVPVLARPVPVAESQVRVRLRGRSGWWRFMPSFVGHHLGLLGLLCGALLYLFVPRSEMEDDVAPGEAARSLAERRARRSGTDGVEVTSRSVTGFPSTVRLGDIGRIKQSDAIAFRAQLADRGQPRDVAPADETLLLMRARAWHRYDPASRAWVAPRPNWVRIRDGMLDTGEAPLTWRFELSGYDDGTLFLPQSARRVQHGSDRLFRDRRTGSLRVEPATTAYVVEAGRAVTRHRVLYTLRADSRDASLRAVPDELRRALERELPRRSGTTLAHSVDAVREYFGSRRFRYTLDLPDLPADRDPILAFLERREGHCELFASAACLFLRMHGVPARVAGGLRLAEREGPGQYLARFRNAHAWVELNCRGAGWVAVDFTPSDARIRAAAAAGGEAAGSAVGTDGDPVSTGGRQRLWRDPFEYSSSDQRRIVNWAKRRVFGWPLAAFVAILATGVAWRVLRRKRTAADPLRVAAGPSGARRTLAFYAKWLRDCAKRGHRRGHAQTPREFLRSLPDELRAEGAELTAEFERRRYGRG